MNISYVKKISFFLGLVLSLTYNKVYASVVYYGGLDEPDVVFEQGIPAHGNSLDIISLFSGQACKPGGEKSLFVSLSNSKANAVDFGFKLASKKNKKYFYVYKVQARTNFIDLNKTLTKASGFRVSSEFGRYDSQDIGKFLNIREMQKDKEQVLVRTMVVNHIIIESYKYDLKGGVVETKVNKNYIKEKNAEPQPLPSEVMHLLMKPSDISLLEQVSWDTPFLGLERNNFPACYMNNICDKDDCIDRGISPYIQSVLKL